MSMRVSASYRIKIDQFSVTPMSSGVKINSLMPNSSILIVQDGPGVRLLTDLGLE